MSKFGNYITRAVRNFYNNPDPTLTTRVQDTPDNRKRDLSYAISPVQLTRIRQSIQSWREAISEAENAFYPQRIMMQRLMLDTVLNEQIIACMGRRKDLTMLRSFKMCDKNGVENPELTKMFQTQWFNDFQNHALDALFYGYSLITLGDVENDSFPNISIVRRANVSPDRLNVTRFVYSISGINFTEQPYADWHIWIPTSTETGVSKCGYGLLYKCAKAEIYLRNNTGFNADFNEIFMQPIRKGKTTKTEEKERAAFAELLANMGSSPWILLDDGIDDIELVESNSTGTAYNSFSNFEERLEKKISKVILGHADAMDSIPGKLGNNSEESPASKAQDDIQVKDGAFLMPVINEQLIPRMRKFGFNIPLEYHFEYYNNKEDEEFRAKEDESNTKTATLMKTIKDAGGDPDWDYFNKRTGMNVKATPPPPPPVIAAPIDKPGEDAPGPGTEKVDPKKEKTSKDE